MIKICFNYTQPLVNKGKDKIYFTKSTDLRLISLVLVLCIFLTHHLSAQLAQDFNQSSLSSIWSGDRANFKINTANQLQLGASTSGASTLYTRYKVPADSIQIDLYFKLQFAPSTDNQGTIYLFSDSPTSGAETGYYLRVGENGNLDAIQIYKVDKGVSKLLASGRMAAMGADPADARLRIKIYRNGLWVGSVDYDGNNNYEEDFEFMIPSFSLPDSSFIVLNAKYTATRADKFFYDDISIQSIVKDVIAPTMTNVEVIDAKTLSVSYDERLNPNFALDAKNYSVDNNVGNPSGVAFKSGSNSTMILTFGIVLNSGTTYNLISNNIRDLSGNAKANTLPFSFAILPSRGDLLISEVLTDPYSGGDDFVELYNNSSKTIKLNGLLIKNGQKTDVKTLSTGYILAPNQYVAISRNTDFLKTTYNTPLNAQFITATLPSLNVSEANITIQVLENGSYVTLDSFDYNQSLHYSLIDATKGVSLERIDFTVDANSSDNWHSAPEAVKFATPGYKNANARTNNPNLSNGFTPNTKTITPNGDGSFDFLLLDYLLDKPGFLATIRVFDTEGFEVNALVNNSLLGSAGSFKWEGVDKEGNILKTGMYIFFIQLLHPDGDLREEKHVVVVANNF